VQNQTNVDGSKARTGHIQSGMAFHAMPARQGILHRRRQGVSQMQGSRNIRRWNDHDKFFGGFIHRFGIAGIESRGFPPILPSGFDRGRMIRVRHGKEGQILLGTFWSGIHEGLFRRDDLDFLFLLRLAVPIGLLFGFAFSLGKFLKLTFR
jgi:hypothetical protein